MECSSIKSGRLIAAPGTPDKIQLNKSWGKVAGSNPAPAIRLVS
jgi:hypothetical protein